MEEQWQEIADWAYCQELLVEYSEITAAVSVATLISFAAEQIISAFVQYTGVSSMC